MADIKFCPNCGKKPDHVKGNKVVCLECNSVFEVTGQGAQVIDDDPISKIADKMVPNLAGRVMAEIEKIEAEKNKQQNDHDQDQEDDDDEDGITIFDTEGEENEDES